MFSQYLRRMRTQNVEAMFVGYWLLPEKQAGIVYADPEQVLLRTHPNES